MTPDTPDRSYLRHLTTRDHDVVFIVFIDGLDLFVTADATFVVGIFEIGDGFQVIFQRFLAFFRTSIRIGIFGKERIQYWNLVVWTLCRCPKLLPLAITLAIHGYHFRKVCKL